MPWLDDPNTSFVPSDGFSSEQLACRQGGAVSPKISTVHYYTAPREDVHDFERLQQELDTISEEPSENVDTYIYESDSDSR
jgi:hypothetical protein